VNRLTDELHRVFGDPPSYPRAVVRVQVAEGQGLAAGREEADRLVDAGAELVVLDSELTAPGARAALAVLLDLEPTEVSDRSAPDWAQQIVATRALIRGARPFIGHPEALVEHLGDPALGRLVGLLAQLTERRTPVVLGGGTGTAVATLLATRLNPGAEQWLLAGSAPDDPHAARALGLANLTPLLDLGLGASGADIAVTVVRAGLEALGA
jgi:nicotinate-nucleotide--dimethylbenzimidazole phosphoribosyltransferase